MSSTETSDVVIIGCGPTGAVLSAFLARQGIRNVVLERESGITSDPRGIALDEDGIRLLQGLGLYDKIYTEIGKVMGVFNFTPGANNLYATPFLRFDYNTIEGGTGHVGFICHKQPAMEKALRSVMENDLVGLRSNSTVTGISEDQDWVYVEYVNPEGQTFKLRSKFLVGADGKTGFTRKKYLEPKGVHMERDPKTRYEEVWVALNWHLTPPTPETHPDFPLWKLGHTPEKVYDLFFPTDFRFLCNPDRPSVAGRFGLEKDRLWRFEFVVKKGEDNMEMSSMEKTREIIMPYLTHPGKRYGLAKDVQWPLDCIECVRSRPFSFSARSCNKWSLGRTILCGDAAHVFPPFGGQGIASGFRDAVSLAWRLAIACRSTYEPHHEHLFKGWYTERKQQLERSLAATIENGNFCTEPSKIKAWIRNWHLWLIQLVPSWRHELEMGSRRDGMIKYDWQPGMPFLKEYEGGRCFPQVFSAPVDGPAPSMPSFTDDAIFAKEKSCLFQLVVLFDDISALPTLKADLARISFHSEGDLSAKEATFILHDFSGPKPDVDLSDTPFFVRVITGGEYSATTRRNPEMKIYRPPPLLYNPNRIRDDVGHDKKFVILRPDRFVFAACRTKEELGVAAGKLQGCLMGGVEGGSGHGNGKGDANGKANGQANGKKIVEAK